MNGTEPLLYDPQEDSDFPVYREEELNPVKPNFGKIEKPAGPTPLNSHNPFGKLGDPGLELIVDTLDPKRSGLHGPPQIGFSPVDDPDGDTVMNNQPEGAEATKTSDVHQRANLTKPSAKTEFEAELKEVANRGIAESLDRQDLQKTASASLQYEAAAKDHGVNEDDGLEKRHDSHQEADSATSPSQERQNKDSGSLTLDTMRESEPEESIATSPTLSKHVISISNDRPGTLAAFHPHTSEDNGTSPQSESLPSIHQIVPAQQYRPLNELAELATQNDHRTVNHASPPLSSTVSLSPGTAMPFHPYPGSAQMSPSSQQTFGARSTTSGYGSPIQFNHSVPYFASRRSSAPADRALGPPPSIPSVSSSGESHGHTSSIDGYSTAHTTPIDPPESTPRPMLPPPHGMVMAPGYKCDAPDCTAPPFQTQYLLSSHKNVHTTARPHFCPIEGCPRGEGGRGFKRKNEMIRHGLVHESPGYVCPFCPDREHRYPRPDNLQRHVRVHHMDKDKDDPELREVLSRTHNNGKQRRRRANTGGSVNSQGG